MLVIAVRYLNGRAVAAHPSTREAPEWPPHPGRLFMALVAAWGHFGMVEQDRRVLEMLEALPPPSLHVPDVGEAEIVTQFVPVNDVESHPCNQHRKKAARHFPSVPIEPTQPVYFIWRDASVSDEDCAVLAGLCSKVTYLGHSSSLVQVTIEDHAPIPNLVPTSNHVKHRLRVPSAGRLQELRECFEIRDSAGAPAPQYPKAGFWKGYGSPVGSIDVPITSNLAGEMIVFKRVSGRMLGLTSTLLLTEVTNRF